MEQGYNKWSSQPPSSTGGEANPIALGEGRLEESKEASNEIERGVPPCLSERIGGRKIEPLRVKQKGDDERGESPMSD